MAMASNQTSNYGLCQWEATDRVLHTDFNEDNQKIDTALKNLQTAVNGKASSSAMNSVASDLEDLSLSCAMVVSGTYKGTGTYGALHPTTLNLAALNRTPLLVVVRERDESATGLVLVNGMEECACNISGNMLNGSKVTITEWVKGHISWFGEGVSAQMNKSGTTYCYFAVG